MIVKLTILVFELYLDFWLSFDDKFVGHNNWIFSQNSKNYIKKNLACFP